MDGRRLAVVVATSEYQDPELRRLRAPAQDAAELVEVLGKKEIGGFDVSAVLDGSERQVRIALESFLKGCGPKDVALVYLSCHGLLDARNQLWFAANDTFKDLLGSTGIAASWLRERLENCRASRQLVLLDCCFSGAYARLGKGSAEVGVETLHGGGRGHVVLTASRATEYSYEGEPENGAEATGSIFTTALVQGLRTGAADLDNDGLITTDEAYDYVNGYLRTLGAKQTPTRTVVGGEGRILLARSPVGIKQTIPAQSTVQVVAEAAEIMAVAPAAPRRPAAPLEGPAAELATLRAIRQVLDDPVALAEVMRVRPVADVVKVFAAIRASGLGERAPDALRVAATARLVGEIPALVKAFRAGPHPADADVLLAAVGSGRPVVDVVRLCERPLPSSPAAGTEGVRQGSDVDQILHWAARTRPVTEVRALSEQLPRIWVPRLLEEAGQARSAGDVVEILATTDETHIPVVLRGVRRRPFPEVAFVVKALRAAGDDPTADRLLGWVDELAVDGIVALVDGLRAAEAGGDADTVLQWAGWRLREPQVAALIAALDAAGQTAAVRVVADAAGSRPLDDLHELVRAAVSNHPDHAGPVLDLAGRRPPAELATLLSRLEPQSHRDRLRPTTQAEELRNRAANRLAAATSPLPASELLALLGSVDSEPVVQRLTAAVATGPVDTVSRFTRALVATDRARTAQSMIVAAAVRPWNEVADLVAAIARHADPAEIGVLLRAASAFPDDRLSAALAGLDRAAGQEVVDLFVEAVPAVRWFDTAMVSGLPSGVALRLAELQLKGQRMRWRHRVASIVGGIAAAVGLLVVATPSVMVFASITRVFGDTGFDRGDWAAWAGTTVVAVGLLGLAAVAILRGADGSDWETVGLSVGLALILGAIAGLVFGWWVPYLSDAATQVRDWLGWKF